MNRTVVVLADDLFWKTKIDHAAKSAQAPAVFISDPAGLVNAAEMGKTALVLVDLEGERELPRAGKLELARALVAEIALRIARPSA